jgi:hypothetical protein
VLDHIVGYMLSRGRTTDAQSLCARFGYRSDDLLLVTAADAVAQAADAGRSPVLSDRTFPLILLCASAH